MMFFQDAKETLEEPLVPRSTSQLTAFSRVLEGIYQADDCTGHLATFELGVGAKNASSEIHLALCHVLRNCKGERVLIITRDCAATGYCAENIAAFPQLLVDLRMFGGSHVLVSNDLSSAVVVEDSPHAIMVAGDYARVMHGNLGTLDGDRIIMNAYTSKDVLQRAGRL